MDRYLHHILRVLVSVLIFRFVKGQSLEVPTAGNCGENIDIYCRHSGSCSQWDFYKDGARLSTYGSSKYSHYQRTSYIRLTINSMALSDKGNYYCRCSSSTSNTANLKYECKPSIGGASITLARKLSFEITGAYPHPSVSVSVNSASKSGGTSCHTSSNSHYNCKWLSGQSLGHGDYSYSITVKTESNKGATGRFSIYNPSSPSVSAIYQEYNPTRSTTSVMYKDPSEGLVVRGYQDRSVTLKCTSENGSPAPLVSLYSGGTELTKSSSGTRHGNRYTVTVSYTLIARRADDLKLFTCQSKYPGATSNYILNQQSVSPKLYLYLKPSQTTITQVNTIVNNGIIKFKCETFGSRPAPESINWNFKGMISRPNMQSQKDGNKISAKSTFTKEVTVVDNGETITCIVKHVALTGELRKSSHADVKFAVKKGSTVLSGNKQVTLTLINIIDLTCTTGSSNPASTITWTNGSLVIPNPNPYASKKGTNNGVIRTQVLPLSLVRYMDGDVISCDVTNDDEEVAADQGNAVSDEVVLDLLYPPEVQPSPSIVYTYEGTQDFVLPCIVTSKPHSAFWWYRLGIDPYILRHSGFSLIRDFYSYNFTFPMVTSADAGEYRCKADNGIGTVYSPFIRFVVKYLRVSAPQSIFAGQIAALNYTLHNIDKGTDVKPWVHEWPNYGEVKRYSFTRDFVLTNLSYQHSGTYTVSVKERSGDAIFLTMSATLFVKSPPVVISPIVTQGRHTVSTKLGSRVDVDIHYYSNIAGDNVKLYKKLNGARILPKQSSVLLTPVPIQLPVMSSLITTTGTLCSVAIYIKEDEDYGDFDIVISNGIGSGTVFPISVIDAGFEMSSAYVTIIVGGVIDIVAVFCVIYLTVFLYRRKLIRCWKTKTATIENSSRSFRQLEEMTETDIAVSNEHYTSSVQQLGEILVPEADIDNISGESVKTNESQSSEEYIPTEDEDDLSEEGADGPIVLDINEKQTSSPSSCEDTDNEDEDNLAENGVDGLNCPGETECISPSSLEKFEKTNGTTKDSADENLTSVDPRQYQTLEAKETKESAYQHLKTKVADITGEAPRKYEKLDAKSTEGGAYQTIKSKAVTDITGEAPRKYETLDAKAKEVGAYQQIKSDVADATSGAPRQYEMIDAKKKEGGTYQQIKSEDVTGEAPRHYEKLDAKTLGGVYQQITSKDINGPEGSKYTNLEINTFTDDSAGKTVHSTPGLYEEIKPTNPDHIYDTATPRKRRKGFFFGLFGGKGK